MVPRSAFSQCATRYGGCPLRDFAGWRIGTRSGFLCGVEKRGRPFRRTPGLPRTAGGAQPARSAEALRGKSPHTGRNLHRRANRLQASPVTARWLSTGVSLSWVKGSRSPLKESDPLDRSQCHTEQPPFRGGRTSVSAPLGVRRETIAPRGSLEIWIGGKSRFSKRNTKTVGGVFLWAMVD